MDADLYELNKRFCIPGHVSFHEAPGKMAAAIINNRFGAAVITLAGAHVMSYRPHGGREMLWTSPTAAYEISNAMRGGIPICWPWFAYQDQDPQSATLHGFARRQVFTVVETRVLSGGGTLLRLVASNSPATYAEWLHLFQLTVTITLSQSLHLAWSARNLGSQPYTYTGAFHPYFAVSNVHNLILHGLEGSAYLDKNEQFQRKMQSGKVTFPGPIDRVYLETTANLAIEDPGFLRTIFLRKAGSRTSVVWNPGQEDANIPDVGAGQHQYFLCVEAANAADDRVTVEPGGEVGLEMDLHVETWRKA